MTHTVIVEFPCAPGKGKEFLSLLFAALVDTRAYAGCLSVETFFDQDNPDLIILWEKWAKRTDQEKYLAWRVESGMLDMIGPFLNGAPKFVHLTAAD
jgi:quinol monooxygenase YgiN